MSFQTLHGEIEHSSPVRRVVLSQLPSTMSSDTAYLRHPLEEFEVMVSYERLAFAISISLVRGGADSVRLAGSLICLLEKAGG
jgi:hypothetical protein